MKKLVLTACLAFVLTSCGFHLRSALVLPPDLGPIRVLTSDPYSALGQSLTLALERAGAKVVDDKATSGVAMLQIRSERWASTPISVDEFGRAQEYSLRYAVVFVLNRPNGTVFVPQQAIELARDYVSVPNNSTGTDTERELLTRELRKDMTASILRRIDAASRSPALAPAPPAPDADSAPAPLETLPDPTATP